MIHFFFHSICLVIECPVSAAKLYKKNAAPAVIPADAAASSENPFLLLGRCRLLPALSGGSLHVLSSY